MKEGEERPERLLIYLFKDNSLLVLPLLRVIFEFYYYLRVTLQVLLPVWSDQTRSYSSLYVVWCVRCEI